MVLIDTCTLLFWTTDPEKLSPKALQACQNIQKQGGLLSSISLWEIGIKIKKKKLNLHCSISDYAEQVKQIESLEIIPVDEDIWLENLNLDWEHEDPADRTIVATAIKKKTPIVTSDASIKSFYKKVIW